MASANELLSSGAEPHGVTQAQNADGIVSSTHANRLLDSSSQQLPNEPSLIKAGIKITPHVDSGIMTNMHVSNIDASQHAILDESAAVLSHAQKQAAVAEEDWTVIQSDGSDTEFASKPGAKLGLVRVRSQVPQEELPQQHPGLPQPALPKPLSTLLATPLRHSSTSTGAKLHRISSDQLLTRKLPTLKVPLTGMGKPRATGRRAKARPVAEGSDLCNHCVAASDRSLVGAQLLSSFLQVQPAESQEEEAAWALHQHLTNSFPYAEPCSNPDTAEMKRKTSLLAIRYRSTAQHAQHSSRQGRIRIAGPVAEGKESIAAFHPSWHLRLNQIARSQAEPDQPGPPADAEAGSSLDQFCRPAAGAGKPPQHQLSLADEAGCLNFGSHLIPNSQLPQKLPQTSQSRQRSAIDDAALSSEEEWTEYQEEQGAKYGDEYATQRDCDGPEDEQAGAIFSAATSGQGRFEEEQYADYCSEQGLSEEKRYPDGDIDREGLHQSLEVLPEGVTTNTEVYSPMSHGVTRVRSMITNRPFLIEDPVSPVAKRLGETIRSGSHVTFDTQDEAVSASAVMAAPVSQEEPLYHDWSQPSANFIAAANAEAAAAAEAEAAAAAEAEAQQASVRKPLSDPNTVKAPKAGAMSRLGDTLFRRSGKRTAETQTTEYREEETQTSDQAEAQHESVSQQMALAGGEMIFARKPA